MGKMDLGNIEHGRMLNPPRIIFYAPEGWGKSTFGQFMPDPIFLPVERGCGELAISRFPQPESFAEVLEAINSLRGEHSHRTLVVDTVDAVEDLIQLDVCKSGKVESIEDYGGGYGKGYKVMAEKWKLFLCALERLNVDRKMTIFLIGHTIIKRFRDPAGPEYDRYGLDLLDKASAATKKWCDAVLFGQHFAVKAEKERTPKGGFRVIHTEHDLAYDAKNRYGLPPLIEVDESDYSATPKMLWKTIVHELKNGTGKKSKEDK